MQKSAFISLHMDWNTLKTLKNLIQKLSKWTDLEKSLVRLPEMSTSDLHFPCKYSEGLFTE